MKPKNFWLWASSATAMIAVGTCLAWAEPPKEDGGYAPPDPSQPRTSTTVVPPGNVRIERIYEGWSAHPIGAADTSAAMTENTVQLFKDAEFKDNSESVSVTSMTAGGSHDLPADMEDSVSALRWNLGPGVIVVMYEDDGAKGEQLALWGKGEMSHLNRWNFNDKPSSWAWYYAGGAPSVTTVLERAAVVYPTGTVVIAREIPAINPGTINVYRNDDFEGATQTITDVMANPPGQLNRLPSGMNDAISSMRWNLPAGVVVTFYQDAGGEKQQAAIWGNGEVRDVDLWDFNDKISRWTWNYIGTRGANVVGYVEPPVRTPVVVTTPAVPVTPAPAVVVTPVTPTTPVGTFIDPLDLVGAAIAPNSLGLTVKDLVARKNPNGQGTFVYAPRVMGAPADRRVVWLVLDSKVYAINPMARTLTPTFVTPADVDDTIWMRTGFNRLNAEQEAVRIVFIE